MVFPQVTKNRVTVWSSSPTLEHITRQKVKVKVTQSCLTLCDPMDYRVHGILQARILEWVVFPFSRGSSQPRSWTQVFCIASKTRTQKDTWSFHGGPVVDSLPCNAEDMGSLAVPGWSHRLQSNLSPCATTSEPTHWSYWSLRALEPKLCNKRSHCNKKPTYRSKRVAPARSN